MREAALLEEVNKPSKFAGQDECMGFWSATGSLAVSMVGTGIVAFPFAFQLCGAAIAPVALIALCVPAHMSYVSLIRCSAIRKVASYTDLLPCVSKGWAYFTNGALLLLLILACVAYVLIAAHIICSILVAPGAETPLLLRNPALFAMILIALLPICLVTSLNGIAAVTAYCTFAIFTVVVLAIWEAASIFVESPPQRIDEPVLARQPQSVLLALPILGCAMFGHMNMSQIYAELRPEVKPHAWAVSLSACTGAGVLYMMVGMAGYFAFGAKTGDDIVTQLAARCGQGDEIIIIIQALLASFIVLKMPLLVMPLRNLTLSLLPGREANVSDLSPTHNVMSTGGLLFCVYVGAIVLPSLSLLLQILGATCVVPLCFVVPARLSWAIEEPCPKARCIAMASFGTLVSVLSLVAVIASQRSGGK